MISKNQVDKNIQANEGMREAFINHLGNINKEINKNKNNKNFYICFDMTNLLDVDINIKWFREAAMFIIGDCELTFYPLDENCEFKIKVIKL